MSEPVVAERKRVEVFLQPGEWFVGDGAHRIRTLLGSCVSVALWHPILRLGAMSHFLLAARGGSPARLADVHGLELQRLDGRYGDEALHLMLHELARKGVGAAQCQGKIFGGGNMFPAFAKSDGPAAVGRRNGEAARDLLHARGIEIVSESLFGVGHRQIAFDVDTGDVWVRQCAVAHQEGLA